MIPDKSSSAGSDDGQIDQTRWSMVLGAVQSRAPYAQKALAELCRLYWRPLYAFARRRGGSPEDAQDLVRGFFAHLIGFRERSKGRFRSFLLASFQSFITAENRRARAETVKILIPRPPKSFFEGIGQFSSLN